MMGHISHGLAAGIALLNRKRPMRVVTIFARRIESEFECWDAVTREFVNWRWVPYGYNCITLESVTHWMPRPEPPEVTL